MTMVEDLIPQGLNGIRFVFHATDTREPGALTDAELYEAARVLAPVVEILDRSWDMAAGLLVWAWPEEWWPTIKMAGRRQMAVMRELDDRAHAEIAWDDDEEMF